MGTNVYIAITVGVVAILGGFGYMAFGGHGTDGGENEHVAAMHDDQHDVMDSEYGEMKAEAGSYSGTFADLTKRGGDWVCSVDHTTVVSDTDGNVYISGKDIRGEFSVDAPYVGNITVNMIADGSDVYSWTSMTPQGVKAPQSDLGEGDTGTETSGQVIDANQVLNYDCQPWSRDDSKFAIPAISFMEVGY